MNLELSILELNSLVYCIDTEVTKVKEYAQAGDTSGYWKGELERLTTLSTKVNDALTKEVTELDAFIDKLKQSNV